MQGDFCTRRRRLLRGAGALAAAGLSGLRVARADVAGPADPAGAFAATTFAEALAALGDAPAPSALVSLVAPEIVENGAIVPITVVSRLPDTQEISIVAEHNPNPLIVRFVIEPGTEPFISTRVKMAASGCIYAVVKADGKLYAAFKNTQVITGGCGG